MDNNQAGLTLTQETHRVFTCATDYNMNGNYLESTQMPFYKKIRIKQTAQKTWYLAIMANAAGGSPPALTLLRTSGTNAATFIRAIKVTADVE